MKVDKIFGNNNYTNLNFLRLDNHMFSEENVIADLIFYRPNTSLLYYVLDSDGKSHQVYNMLMPNNSLIQAVRVIKSRFLMIETKLYKGDETLSPSLRSESSYTTMIYLLDMESTKQIDKVNNIIEDYCLCSKAKATPADRNNSAKWADCAFKVQDMEYVNSYNLPESPGNFFFEFKNKINNMTEALTTTDRGRIDVFLCQKGAFTECEPIIKDWSELTHRTALRFTGISYFLQIWANFTSNFTNITDSQNKSKETTLYNLLINFSMSPKRYKAVPRIISTHNISMGEMVPDTKLNYYFDEVSELIYITGKNFSNAYKIDAVKLRIKFDDFNSSCVDDKTNQDTVSKPDILPPLSTINWITFQLEFANKNVSHNLAYDDKTNIGEYFFMPNNAEKTLPAENPPKKDSETTIHTFNGSLPMGVTKSIDLSDLFRGSFIKLKTSKPNNTLQEISNTYLDPYRYKLKMKKPKFLEDFYLVDTEIGEKRKVYIMISTKTDNLIYVGNRFSESQEVDLSPNYGMRDFRMMTDFYPINTTHGLVQVQDLIYTISPFETINNIEIPSKGINGVCYNSTLMFHDKLGPLHFCIYESKAFYKRLLDDSSIKQIMMSKETEDLMKTVNKIRFIKRSDNYINHIFMIYTLHPDLLKDNDNLKDYTLFIAILRIDHKADPRLSMVSKYQMPFNNTFDTNANLFAFEIAGSRAIFLERSNVEKGEHRIGIMSFERGQAPEILYYLPLNTKLLVEPNTRFILSNMADENDIDLNQNSVMSIENRMYQICFKVVHADTKENKIVIFSPQAPSFSSMSIIELPPEFKVVEFGPMFSVTKDYRRSSLSIMAAKTAVLDEEFMSRESEMYIFMVTDMTPTLMFKPFTNTTSLLESPTEGSIYNMNYIRNYTFNVTSSIYSEEKIKENKQRSEGARELLDTVTKCFNASYERWGNMFDSGMNSSNDNVSINIEIKSMDYKRDKSNLNLSSSERDSKLERFFVRLDPLNHMHGHIFDYKGHSESSIEDFTGIVKVLSPKSKRPISINSTITKIMKEISEKQLGKVIIDWSCSKYTNQNITTYLERDNSSSTVLSTPRRCPPKSTLNVIASWNNTIFKVYNHQLTDITVRFDRTATNFMLHNSYLFYVEQTITQSEIITRVCRQDINSADLDRISSEGNKELLTCSKDSSTIINSNYKPNRALSSLTMEINNVEGPDSPRYIITLIHYNKPMSIYTLVEFFDLEVIANNSSPHKFTSRLNNLGSIYVASNNLKVAYSISKTSLDANHTMITMDAALIYYRWRQITELTLMQDLVEFRYSIDNVTGLLRNLTAVDYTNNSKTTGELQGFTFKTFVRGRLMKFATLLCSLKNPNNMLRPIVEQVKIWVPEKSLYPTYTDSTWKNTTGSVPIFKIIVDFPASNAYLLHSNIAYLKQEFLTNETADGAQESKNLGGRAIKLSEFKIAPLENPFIGFKPESMNPEPQFIDDYFFVINNYHDKSYFYFYTLEPSKLRFYDGLGNKTHNNIFGMNSSNTLDSKTIYSEEQKPLVNHYMRVNQLIPLSERVTSMMAVPNCQPDQPLEHCLAYLTNNERMMTYNFTSFINIRIRTHKIASRRVSVNVTGKYGRIMNLTLNVFQDSSMGLWAKMGDFSIVLIWIGIGAGIAVVTMIVIQKDVAMTHEDNKQQVSRHSVKPITNLIYNYLENNIVPAEDNKNNEYYSDDSDESEEDLRKNLMGNKKPENNEAPRIVEPLPEPPVDPPQVEPQVTHNLISSDDLNKEEEDNAEEVSSEENPQDLKK